MAITFKSERFALDSKRFEIRSMLGQGGFGVVYRAFDRDLGAQVALKTLHHTNARSVFRFKREFRALADIAHPNLATLFELIQEESLWYFTMELVDGVDFFSWVRGVRGAKGQQGTPTAEPDDLNDTLDASAEPARALHTHPRAPQPGFRADLPRLYEALRQLTQGVRALHEYGKMHRDIKPSNVLVARDGRVVLLDFGMVADMGPADSPLQALERQSDPSKLAFAGTPRYMAPEQALGEDFAAATDWYSVGVMLYEALSGGIAPIDAKTSLQLLLRKQSVAPVPILERAPKTPPLLGKLCMDLLSVDPARRPGAAQILAVLETLQSSAAGGAGARVFAGGPAQVDAQRAADLLVDVQAAQLLSARALRAPHFVGRSRQLQTLRRTLRDASVGGRLAVVNIHGTSGMGKTTLARRFIDSLGDPADAGADELIPVVLQGRCYPNESMPYKALDSLMDDLSTYLHRFDASELAEWVGEQVGALTYLFPVLVRAPAIRELLEAGQPGGATSGERIPVDVNLLREQAFGALRNLLDGLARKHTLVLYIDDVQWGDEDSARLLKELLGPPSPPPLFLMSSWRIEDVESSPFLGVFLSAIDALGDRVLRVDLPVGKLSDAESIELIERLFEGVSPLSVSSPPARTDAERARSIALEAQGNPFFIDELTRYSLIHDSGPDSDVSTLGDMIFRRISTLPAPARRLLEVLSVAGQPLDRRVARVVAKLGEDEPSALALLRSEHLVRGKSTRDYEWLETYHARVGETLIARLDVAQRVVYHGELAVELARGGHFDPETVALHFLAAGDNEKGGHYSLLAARRAQDALAFEHAALLYQQALDARDWPDKRAKILTELGHVHGYLGRGRRAAEAFLAAAELSNAQDARELTTQAAEHLLRVGNYERGMALVDGLLRDVGFKKPGGTPQIISAILWLRYRLRRRNLDITPVARKDMDPHDYARIEVLWTAAKMLALIDPMLGGYYHYHAIHLVMDTGSAEHLTLLYCHQAAQEAVAGGDLEFAADLIERAQGYVDFSSDPVYVACYVPFMRGFCDYVTGDFQSGLAKFRQAGKSLSDNCTGVIWQVGYFKFFEYLPGLWLGDFSVFVEEIPRLIEQANERNDTYHRVALRSWQYPAHLANDAPDVARRELARALAEWTRESYHIQHFWYLQGAVDTALYAGEPAEARALLERHQRPLKRSMLLRNDIVQITVWNLWARTVLAELRGAPTAAAKRALTREARKFIKKLRHPKQHAWTHPLADLLDAELSAITGNTAAARRGFERAEAGLIARDINLYARAARRRLGELVGGKEGAALVASADEWMRAHGVTNPPAMTRMLVGGV